MLDQRIIGVALRLFLEEGYDAATIERVAAEAETTRRSVQHRYSSKDALLIAAADHYLAKLRSEVLSRVEADNREPMDALRRGCRLLFANSIRPETIAFHRLSLHQAYRIPELSVKLTGFSDELERWYARFIHNAQSSGIFERHSARSLSRVVVGVFASNPLNRVALGDIELLTEDGADDYFSEAWSVFLAAA